MLKVYQICFQEQQKEFCDYTPYMNADCDEYFENSVIRKLIEEGEHKDAEYFGVVSYKLRHKIGTVQKNWSIDNIKNHSTNTFHPDAFEFELNAHKPDAMSFQRHASHDTVTFANNFHPNFSKYFDKILSELSLTRTNKSYKDIFYCNFFVAKAEIYEHYVKSLLTPAMDVMKSMPELWGNSRYPHPLPQNISDRLSIDHYPYHSFICERLFTYYADKEKLNCRHY